MTDSKTKELPETGLHAKALADGLSEEQPPVSTSITDLTGGLEIEAVEELVEVKGLDVVYPILHVLVGQSPTQFIVRAAALRSIITFGEAALSSRDLDSALYWLSEEARDSTLRILRQSGLLQYEPSVGTTVTDAGRWAFDILSFLSKRLGEAELRHNVAGINYSIEIGADPVWHLESLKSSLVDLRSRIERARTSHSEVLLRRAQDQVGEALELSHRIRTALDKVPLSSRGARRVVQEVHELLSHLHDDGARLHSEITEVGRQYLKLTQGLTVEQIVRALMGRKKDEIATAGEQALHPFYSAPVFINTDIVAAAAEYQAIRERTPTEEVSWQEPVEPKTASTDELVPEAVMHLLTDLLDITDSESPHPLSSVIPRRNAGESFFRASLLSLVGQGRTGEGVAGRLGELPLDVEPDGDGWPEDLDGEALSGLTPGAVLPKERDSR